VGFKPGDLSERSKRTDSFSSAFEVATASIGALIGAASS
jgi:hypothetical protein